MSQKTLTKVVKLPLIFLSVDGFDGDIDYKKVNEILWKLQDEIRQVKNRSIRYFYEDSGLESGYFKKYLQDNQATVKQESLQNYIYNLFSHELMSNTKNLSTTLQIVRKAFKDTQWEMETGQRSMISYKKDQPIDLHKGSIKGLQPMGQDFCIQLSLLRPEMAKSEYGLPTGRFNFKCLVKDNSTRSILQRCYEKLYRYTASKLVYDRDKHQWVMMLTYCFEAEEATGLDPNRILGVDLGIKVPICASVYGDLRRFTIQPGEIEAFRKNVEARRRSLLKQGAYCGDGRIGHGRATRNKPAQEIADKIKRFRDTANHKYARALVDFAVKNQCGVIQMEKLEGITEGVVEPFLKDWTHYDLRAKVENKAKELGIKVIFVDPQYTSQRCSRCGHIDKENRLTQARFVCTACGFEENADYNASQNLAIKGIDLIIEKELGAKSE